MSSRSGAGSRARFVARLCADPKAHYHNLDAISRDRRLRRSEQLQVVEAWPCADDFERGQAEIIKRELRKLIATNP